MNILIVSSCTGSKLFSPSNILTLEDFKDVESYKNKIIFLENYKVKALDMYTGKQHLYIKEGINLLSRHNFPHKINFKIISAGYGYIDNNTEIYPYEVTFNTMGNKNIKQWSKKLKITENLQKDLINNDVIIFLLGKSYLNSIDFNCLTFLPDQKIVFFASEDIPIEHSVTIKCSLQESIDYGCSLISLKGFMFKLLCQELVKNPDLCYTLDSNILEGYKKKNLSKRSLF